MEKKPKLNVALLKQIVKHLREEPKRYNQSNWGKRVEVTEPGAPACGTQGCIAGWATLLSVPQELWTNLFAGGVFYPLAVEDGGGWLRDLHKSAASNVAQRLLGLTDEEAYGLFSANNQSSKRGEAGVAEATRKIRLLIQSRVKFVERYC